MKMPNEAFRNLGMELEGKDRAAVALGILPEGMGTLNLLTSEESEKEAYFPRVTHHQGCVDLLAQKREN